MSKQHAIIMWVIWFSFFQTAFILNFFLGGGFPSGPNSEEPMAFWYWIVAGLPLVAATFIRWKIIPALKEPQKQLVAMIVGLALSEGAIFVEIFLIGPDYPQYQVAVLMASVFCTLQFAPSYATPGYKLPKDKSVDG